MTKAKYLKPGDCVKIINPQVFVRCGYPLCKNDMHNKYHDFIMSESTKILSSLPNCKSKQTLHNFLHNSNAQDKLEDAIAYALLSNEGFGGSNRIIVTREYPNIRDSLAIIMSKRFVYTGERRDSGGFGGSYYYADDYDPPCLHGAKAHCIYGLSLVSSFSLKKLFIYYNLSKTKTKFTIGLEIESIHCSLCDYKTDPSITEETKNFIEGVNQVIKGNK